MAPKVAAKRKAPASTPTSSNNRSAKRVKIGEARKILAEPPDKALNKNGDLDVAAFVKAREFEIRAMMKSMEQSKTVLKNRAFQQVPRQLRRRTASHNVKKVPKRLQARAKREISRHLKMKEDNTPTGTARRKKPDTHKRLRLEKAKELKAKGVLKKKQRAAKKKGKEDAEGGGKSSDPTTSRLSQPKKNTLIKSPRPPAKFRKRQVNKSWLPTHVWHAKRAHMTEPQYPLWRFAIPLSPNEKVFRTTHRAATMRGCVAWDTSYMSTIALEGVEASLLGLMRSLGLVEGMLTGGKGFKWRQGRRGYTSWIRDRDKKEIQIAPVTFFWCATDEDLERSMNDDQLKKRKRKMILRVHPSAFFQTWDEVLKVAKMQRPQVLAEDLRFEVGSIEITGAGSTEALIAALQPVVDAQVSTRQEQEDAQEPDTAMPDASAPPGKSEEDGWEDFESPGKVWPNLAGLTNPSALPADALLAFSITDPRLRHPARTISVPSSVKASQDLLQLLTDWPPDSNSFPADIFNRTARLIATRRLASQKSINRRKSATTLGETPPPLPKDPSIPILLHATRQGPQNSTQGRWTLLLPWDCVLPVWYTLVHYPLSTGGTPLFGCLAQRQQIALETSSCHFPSDFPGTKAGWEWEMRAREVAKLEWDRKPRGRRVEYGSLDLGNGEGKGEIGLGWACDWERLVLGKDEWEKAQRQAGSSQQQQEQPTKPPVKPSKPPTKNQSNKDSKAKESSEKEDPSPQTSPPIPSGPPHNILQLQHPLPISPLPPSTALTPIHLTLPTGGHPSRRARIYRLPTSPTPLAQKWRALTNPTPTPKSKSNPKRNPQQTPNNNKKPQTSAEQVRALAKSLLQPPPPPSRRWGEEDAAAAKPGDPGYPSVPSEADLVGFVTNANYDLGKGRCAAMGNVILARLLEGELGASAQEGGEGAADECGDGRESRSTKKKLSRSGWVIVRDAGQVVGRVARWEIAV